MELKDIIVRAAQPADKTAVLAFCQHTWANPEDYIAAVWDQWMADPSGQILVAVLHDQPIAMTRVVQLSQQEGWWERTYWLHTPQSHQKNAALPLVIAFHGYGSQGKDLARSSGLDALADRVGFVVVYPDGLDRRWNVGEFFSGPEDVTLTAELIRHLTQIRAIDQRRIYVFGVSNGGFLVQQLACVSQQRSLPIAAFASVAAALPQPLEATCRPPAPIPLLMINGTADQKVPWQGGVRPYGTILSVPQTIEFWRQRNGCRANAPIQQRPTSQVTITHYTQCQSQGEVELVTLAGAGHVFPRGGGGNMGLIDGSQEVWRFFQHHSSNHSAQ